MGLGDAEPFDLPPQKLLFQYTELSLEPAAPFSEPVNTPHAFCGGHLLLISAILPSFKLMIWLLLCLLWLCCWLLLLFFCCGLHWLLWLLELMAA
jgi:hypothetical protein